MRLKQRFLYFFANQIPKTMHLLLYVNRNILTLAPLGQDGPRGGLTRKSQALLALSFCISICF